MQAGDSDSDKHKVAVYSYQIRQDHESVMYNSRNSQDLKKAISFYIKIPRWFSSQCSESVVKTTNDYKKLFPR